MNEKRGRVFVVVEEVFLYCWEDNMIEFLIEVYSSKSLKLINNEQQPQINTLLPLYPPSHLPHHLHQKLIPNISPNLSQQSRNEDMLGQCCNKFTQQYNYTLILLASNANIINTRKMIPPICEVKIEEPSATIPPPIIPETQVHRDRVGNSRVFTKTGHWSESEKLRYLLFIDHHGAKLATRDGRKLWRVFRTMASFVGTRRAAQCRSHHQKMEHYYQSLPNILKYLKNKVQDYPRHYQQARPQLIQLSFGSPHLLSSDRSLEDRANNEMGVVKESKQKGGRRRSSNTSIRMEGEGDYQDKDLLKTDHTLPPQAYHPSTNPSRPQIACPCPHQARPQLDYSQLQPDSVSYPLLSYPFLSTLSFLPLFMGWGEGINETGFFQFHRRRCGSWEEAGEWMECELLYRQWRSTLQSLIHSNL